MIEVYLLEMWHYLQFLFLKVRLPRSFTFGARLWLLEQAEYGRSLVTHQCNYYHRSITTLPSYFCSQIRIPCAYRSPYYGRLSVGLPSSRLRVRSPAKDTRNVGEVSNPYTRRPPGGMVRRGHHVSISRSTLENLQAGKMIRRSTFRHRQQQQLLRDVKFHYTSSLCCFCSRSRSVVFPPMIALACRLTGSQLQRRITPLPLTVYPSSIHPYKCITKNMSCFSNRY